MDVLITFKKLAVFCILSLLIWSLSFQTAIAAWEINTDRPGMDYRNFWIDGEAFTGTQKCENACKSDSKCKSFTYVKPGVQGSQGRCYLKEGIPSPITNKDCCVSGVVRPESKSDKCQNYAITAVQQNKNNLNFNCGYSGSRWGENLKAHFNWCMRVPESASEAETAEREKLIRQCWQPSLTGDLAANWCYRIDKTPGKKQEISFFPIIKNVGKSSWKSAKEGYWIVGVSLGSSHKEKRYIFKVFSSFVSRCQSGFSTRRL